MEMDLSLPDFLEIQDAEKVRYIDNRAILYAQQFTRADLDNYCALAQMCRELHKTREGQAAMGELLRYRMALNFFVQPSSRTFMSFNTAQAFLGLNRMSVRDLAISSMSKGETLVDSIRTFISYVDLVVMRHPDENAGAAAFWTSMQAHRRVTLHDGSYVPVPIISGGSGSKQHPTQALLDVYTLNSSLKDVGGIDGKTIMLVGDLKRGRTVRSLSYLMKNYKGAKLLFAAPEKYQMLPDITDFLDREGVTWKMIGSIDEGVDEADGIYMTRIQDEWDGIKGDGHVRAGENFVFRMRHLDRMKPHCALLHPLPKRDEVEEAVDYVKDDRVAYWRQERNGMWMRVAIIARLFHVDGHIRELHGQLC